ncbi:MAG TPA: hypothetical protein VM013_06110 [Dehalococcoidia bacterium]|nr:hypothetical protein [Dehalococcoidia bacterium]
MATPNPDGGESKACCLDTVQPANVPFYEKRGFEVFSEGDVGGSGPHYWRMKRQPRG